MLTFDASTNTFSGKESIACSIKADADSTESKTLTLDVEFNQVTLAELLGPAMKSIRIAWQNGPGRKGFENWTNGQHIAVDAKHPGKSPEDPKALLNKMLAKGLTKEQILALLQDAE